MEFLGIGPLELAFILVIALLVLGPKDLVSTARAAGRFLNRLYHSETWRTVTRASRTLRQLPNQLAREAALEELDASRRRSQAAPEASRPLPSGESEAFKAWTQAPHEDVPPPESAGDVAPKPPPPEEG